MIAQAHPLPWETALAISILLGIGVFIASLTWDYVSVWEKRSEQSQTIDKLSAELEGSKPRQPQRKVKPQPGGSHEQT